MINCAKILQLWRIYNNFLVYKIRKVCSNAKIKHERCILSKADLDQLVLDWWNGRKSSSSCRLPVSSSSNAMPRVRAW